MKGIWTREQYEALGERRRYSGASVAYTLLRVSNSPTDEEIAIFEDINFTLRTTNGIFRTTFRNRFAALDQVVLEMLKARYSPDVELLAEDRGASNGLTSYEWARLLREHYPKAHVLSSDILHYFYELDLGEEGTFVVEPNGNPLQYIRPPYVVGLGHPPSWKHPLGRLVAWRARRRFHSLGLKGEWWKGQMPYRVSELSCLHPEGVRFAASTGALSFAVKSVFETAAAPCAVVRTMNILNRSYFDEPTLRKGIAAAHGSLTEGGLWVVGRTMEDDFTNHVSIFERRGAGWQLVQRMGRGSEIEQLASGGGGG